MKKQSNMRLPQSKERETIVFIRDGVKEPGLCFIVILGLWYLTVQLLIHLSIYPSIQPFIYPSKPMLCLSFYHCPLRKKSCPAQRGRGISTGAHYCHTFHESGYTAHVHWLFFCRSEQGLQFPYPDHELCTPDSSVTTRGCSLISMCAHLPLTPSHLGSSSQNNSAKLGTLDQLIGISPDLTLASPLSVVIGFPSPVHLLYIPTSRCSCSPYVVDLLTVLGSVRDTEGLRMSSMALTWCSL